MSMRLREAKALPMATPPRRNRSPDDDMRAHLRRQDAVEILARAFGQPVEPADMDASHIVAASIIMTPSRRAPFRRLGRIGRQLAH